jgi:hypothetical protein
MCGQQVEYPVVVGFLVKLVTTKITQDCEFALIPQTPLPEIEPSTPSVVIV